MAPTLDTIKGFVHRPNTIDNIKGMVKKTPSLQDLRVMVKRQQTLNNIGGFVKKAFEKDIESRYEAHQRLQDVLLQDRSTLTSDRLASLKNDLLLVMAKYLIIERDCLNIDIKQVGQSLVLIASVRVYMDDDMEGLEGSMYDVGPLLSRKKTSDLKKDIFKTIVSYLPAESGSVTVDEERLEDSVMLISRIRLVYGVEMKNQSQEPLPV